MLSCPLCLKPHFPGVDALRSSLISVATSQISCPVCNEHLLGLDKLTIHLFSHITSIVHEQQVEEATKVTEQKEDELLQKCVRCEICNFCFADESVLEMHQKLLHQTSIDIVTGSHCHHCHLCSKKFKMKGSLMVHLRVAHYGFGHHSGSGNCAKHSGTSQKGQEEAKQQHLGARRKGVEGGKASKVQENKQWECEVCSKMFTTKYFLKKHKRLHTGEMPYFCAQCNKSFTFQQSYHKHMLYHSSEKPHVCGECGRAFKELSTLHNHERIHSGERPFACETCGKCFRQRVSYLVHRRIHTGVMPYKCTLCNKTFRYKVSQRSHKCSSATSDNCLTIPNFGGQNGLESTNNLNSNPLLNSLIFNAKGELVSQNYCDKLDNSLPTSNTTRKESEDAVLGEQSKSPPPLMFVDQDQPDFLQMVLSPRSSPATTSLPDVQSLCLTQSPENSASKHASFHTINEESLKQLLYGDNDH